MRLEFQELETKECITLAEAKLHCRIDSDAENDYVTSLITRARAHCENWIASSFLPQSWKVYYDLKDPCNFNRPYILLPHNKIMSVTEINSYNTESEATVFSSSNYFLSGDRVILKSSASWPYGLREFDSLCVEFISGYGEVDDEDDITETVPSIAKQAMLELMLHWHENRAALYDSMNTAVPTFVANLPHGVLSKLQPYKRYAI